MGCLKSILKKSTNVRFFSLAAAGLLATGCVTVAPPSDAIQQYRSAGPAVCENFGPETRCSHPDSSRLVRELDRFNRSTQLGLRGW